MKDAEHTFSQMVKKKAPDVALCSYQSGSMEPLVAKLQSIGVGEILRNQNFESPTIALLRVWTRFILATPSTISEAKVVSAGYFSWNMCKLFLIYQWNVGKKKNGWANCAHNAITSPQSFIVRDPLESIVQHPLCWLATDYQKPRWPTVDENRWTAILAAIQRNLSDLDYFRSELDSGIFLTTLVDNNLSWNCADASLFLEEIKEKYGEAPNRSRIAQLPLSHFETWFTMSTTPETPRENYRRSDPKGYSELRNELAQ